MQEKHDTDEHRQVQYPVAHACQGLITVNDDS